jgi:hypothetical protein
MTTELAPIFEAPLMLDEFNHVCNAGCNHDEDKLEKKVVLCYRATRT